jgi:hypothetical protein
VQRIDRHEDRVVEPPRTDPATGRPLTYQDDTLVTERRIDDVEARQGWSGRPILWVLIAGLILGAIYLVVTQFWAADEVSDIPAGEVAPAGDIDLAPPAVDLAPSPAPAGVPPAEPAPAAPNTPTPAP